MTVTGVEEEKRLPALREDLALEAGGPFANGAPSWLLYDAMRHRFFRISREMFDLLSVWRSTTLSEFVRLASRHLGRKVQPNDADEVVQFLFANNLTQESADGSYLPYQKQNMARKHGAIAGLLHNYLFLKIPLFNPQPLLNYAWPWLGWLFTRATVMVLALLAILGLYLVSRQWEVFTATFLAFFSFEGLAYYGLSLVILKFLHEFGHAFLAKKHGVRVPVIGVAFLLLFPVLFTDTSEAARLKERRQRLLIDCGGILVELGIAVIATLLWVFLPEGLGRSIAFSIATLSWILSLAVNLNPFMRFDGYFILSDAIGVENLQERGFALARWRLREILFKPGTEPPEAFSSRMRVTLICYAWGTWIYRFFLFLGIAFLVYSFFIKLVGIVLFLVEIYWFIARPILREFGEWWKARASYLTGRTFVTGLMICVALLLLLTPWQTRIDAPAILKAKEFQIFPATSAKLALLNLREGQHVKEGDLLARFGSPELEAQIRISTIRLETLELKLKRATSSAWDRSLLKVIQQEHFAAKQKLKGLFESRKQLEIVAHENGVVSNVDPLLHQGQWVANTHRLAILRSEQVDNITALVAEHDVSRLSSGATGFFFPDGYVREKYPVHLLQVAQIAERGLSDELHSDLEGGRISVVSEQKSELVLRDSWYGLTLNLDKSNWKLTHSSQMRGLVVLEGKALSYAERIFSQVFSVLIRESGF